MKLTPFSDGLFLVVKRECPTCSLVEPVVRFLAADKEIGGSFRIYVQDDPDYLFDLMQKRDDTNLKWSYQFGVATVPILIRCQNGREVGRSTGWVREEWRQLTGLDSLGEGMPEF